jgi:hypothetical protein
MKTLFTIYAEDGQQPTASTSARNTAESSSWQIRLIAADT